MANEFFFFLDLVGILIPGIPSPENKSIRKPTNEGEKKSDFFIMKHNLKGKDKNFVFNFIKNNQTELISFGINRSDAFFFIYLPSLYSFSDSITEIELPKEKLDLISSEWEKFNICMKDFEA